MILSYSWESRARSVTLPPELIRPVRAATDRYRSARERLEEVPVAIVGAFDIHRGQLTYKYTDTLTGEVSRVGSVRPTGSICGCG